MTARIRDMSEAAFRAALKRRGWRWQGFLGYVEIDNGISVSTLNAGNGSWRARLAYLIEQNEKYAVRAGTIDCPFVARKDTDS